MRRPDKQAWRFYTIPGPGEPGNDTWAGDSWKRGGASVWVTGAYDPELNLLYYGIGNPGPDYHSDSRKGDNLYSDSIVALDADTASCAGITSSRRTTCTTGMRPRSRCWPI